MNGFVLDSDPTRWGSAPDMGLSPQAEEFLRAHVGEPSPRPAPDWDSLRIEESRLSPTEVGELCAMVGERWCSTDSRTRARHAGGLSYRDLLDRRADQLRAPDAVVQPGDEQQIAALLAWCATHDVAAIGRGGGTSVVGGLRPPEQRRAIAVLTDRFDRIIDLDPESLLVTVGAGITGPELERQLATRGLTLGHFPQSWQRATIGGYAATRSAGQASSGYGRSDEMIESLRVVTPRGAVRVGQPPASAAGPQLQELFVGSEGAFGIITEVTLRVRRSPASVMDTAVVFPDFGAGLRAFRRLVQRGAAADVMRLSDPQETAVTLALSGPSGNLGAALSRYLRARGVTDASLAVLGWEGDRQVLAMRRMNAWPTLRGSGAVWLGPKAGASWRRHRFDGPFLRDHLMDAGYLVETLETATRWSRLSELREIVAQSIRAELADSGVYVMAHVSHVYRTGASVYFTVIARQAGDPVSQWGAAKIAASNAIQRFGATITHHHGVGRDHAPWLPDEIGEVGFSVLRAVKADLDPADVCNPGVLGL